MKRIPILMSHGIEPQEADGRQMTLQRFRDLMAVVAHLGFESIGYDQLEAWRNGIDDLPARPFMIDFDHFIKILGSYPLSVNGK